MQNNEIEFNIKNIGPIEKSTIKLNDITILLGLPNSGKSYALRSLYWYLQLLDENKFAEIEKSIDASGGIDYEQSKDLDLLEEKLRKYITNYVKSSKTEEILYHENMEISFDINSSRFEKIIDNFFKTMLRRYTNSNFMNRININKITLKTIINDAIKVVPNSIENLKPDQERSFMYSIFPIKIPAKDYYNIRTKLRRFPLSVNVHNTEFKIDGNKINVNVDFEIREFQRDLFDSYKPYGFEFKMGALGIPTSRYSYIQVIISYVSSLIEKFIVKNVLSAMKSGIEDTSGIHSVKFIPYGRNFIIQLYNNSLNKSIYSPIRISDTLKTLDFMPYLSYFKWVDKGKVILADNSSDNIKLFEFILEGKIIVNKISNGLEYVNKDGASVNLNISSAMVEELTGLMLPILASNKDDLIIIEEPESQLHVRTQILMGILLTAIVKKTGMKIIFSTHSDTLALVMNYIAGENVKSSDISNLISMLYNNNSETPIEKPLTKVFDSANKIKINYYSNKAKKFEQVKNFEIRKDVPYISDATSMLFEWVLGILRKSKSGENE